MPAPGMVTVPGKNFCGERAHDTGEYEINPSSKVELMTASGLQRHPRILERIVNGPVTGGR